MWKTVRVVRFCCGEVEEKRAGAVFYSRSISVVPVFRVHRECHEPTQISLDNGAFPINENSEIDGYDLHNNEVLSSIAAVCT
jgi:hypothetical protein